MAYFERTTDVLPKIAHSAQGTEKLWQEFLKPRTPNPAGPGIAGAASF